MYLNNIIESFFWEKGLYLLLSNFFSTNSLVFRDKCVFKVDVFVL